VRLDCECVVDNSPGVIGVGVSTASVIVGVDTTSVTGVEIGVDTVGLAVSIGVAAVLVDTAVTVEGRVDGGAGTVRDLLCPSVSANAVNCVRCGRLGPGAASALYDPATAISICSAVISGPIGMSRGLTSSGAP